jgi:cell pole-organizing protein PopZ
MNKPAPKEPSMDEILSSIRQIIADDDAAGAPRTPTPIPAPAQDTVPWQNAPRVPPVKDDALETMEPLALSADQIVVEEAIAKPAPISFDSMLAEAGVGPMPAEAESEPELVDPEDITFDIDPEPRPEPIPVPRSFAPEPRPTPDQPAPRPTQTVAEAAPMPDPTLSSDMAEQLIEPATDAAVRHAFSRLGGLALGNQGATIEGMIRDMLRPMLKDWLDENLPAVVERMVEKEIGRISRGID